MTSLIALLQVLDFVVVLVETCGEIYYNLIRSMDRVNLIGNINSNLVSNIVPEPNNRRDLNNRPQSQPQESREVIVEINRVNTNESGREQVRDMASGYERAGDVYEEISRPESAVTAYQTSYALNPNPEVVQKIDDLAAKIASEGKF